jgi:glycosyltransferase involved in cell wall biosynthesis
MINPFVSVIIPNYNHAQFLDERIQSVINQTYQNFELIILDDNSTDNSVEVISKYKDNPHVSKIVVNEQNSGSGFKQWHKGFELAKGDIVWIAESDDSCGVTLLETLVKGYVEHHAVLAFCRSCKYDKYGKRSFYEHQKNLPCNISLYGRDFISKYMIRDNLVANASSVIFDRQIAMSLDKQYMEMRGEGDWLFWIEIMERGNVFFVDQELNYFRFHETNTTSSLTYKGVNPVEHKVVFDYLVSHDHLVGVEKKREILRLFPIYMGSEYESTAVRRKVMDTWDKNRFIRLYMWGSMIKGVLKYPIKFLW